MMRNIQARQEQFSVNYADQVLPDLFLQQNSDCDFYTSMRSMKISDISNELFNTARHTLLVACNQLTDLELIEKLKIKADSGVRIYLLLGDAQQNHSAIDTLKDRCLIRTGLAQNGVLVLKDHTTNEADGWLLMYGTVMDSHPTDSWVMQLEAQQIDDLYRSFCANFWENSSDEHMVDSGKQSAKKHPDGQVITNHSHQLLGQLQQCMQASADTASSTSSLAFGVGTNADQILISPDTDNLSVLAKHGVALSKSKMPALVFSSAANWLLPDAVDNSKVNWCLRLSDAQHKNLKAAYEKAHKAAAWQFSSGTHLDTFKDQQNVRFADQPSIVQSVDKKLSFQLPDVRASNMDSFLNDAPEVLAADHTSWSREKLAENIDYTVNIQPPRCPAEAKKDPIYTEWDKIERKWQDKLDNLSNIQENIEKKQQNISEKIRDTLGSFLVAQGQVKQNLSEDLQRLREWSASSATPADRREYTNQLEQLIKDITKRGESTATKIDSAEQERLWNEKKQDFNSELEELRAVLKSHEDKLKQANADKSEKIDAVEVKFSADWKAAVESLTADQVAGLKLESPDDMAMLLAMDSSNATNLRGRIKDKLWSKHYKKLQDALVNFRFSVNKVEKDIKAICSESERAGRDIEHVQNQLETLGESFHYQPKENNAEFAKQLGLKTPVTEALTFNWPDEDLPSEGTVLYRNGNQRYLVIEHHEQIAQANEDASRLKAKVVVKQESQGA